MVKFLVFIALLPRLHRSVAQLVEQRTVEVVSCCHPWVAGWILTQRKCFKFWALLVSQLLKNLPAKEKKSACDEGDLGSIPGLGRSPGEGNGYPLQYSGLENSMDCIVHGLQTAGQD